MAKHNYALGEAEGRALGEAEGRAVGEAVGRAEMLRALLRYRGLDVSEEIEALLVGATADQIEAWFVRALEATDVAQVFEEEL